MKEIQHPVQEDIIPPKRRPVMFAINFDISVYVESIKKTTLFQKSTVSVESKNNLRSAEVCLFLIFPVLGLCGYSTLKKYETTETLMSAGLQLSHHLAAVQAVFKKRRRVCDSFFLNTACG